MKSHLIPLILNKLQIIHEKNFLIYNNELNRKIKNKFNEKIHKELKILKFKNHNLLFNSPIRSFFMVSSSDFSTSLPVSKIYPQLSHLNSFNSA